MLTSCRQIPPDSCSHKENMLTGQVLVHWDFLSALLGEKNSLVRCELNTGAALVGLMIPHDMVEPWWQMCMPILNAPFFNDSKCKSVNY